MYGYNNPYQQFTPQNNLYNSQQFTQPQQFLKVIPVTTIDEARASVVDTANSIPSFFYNKAKNELYLKQFDINTGNAIFLTYKPSETPTVADNSSNNTNPYTDEFKALNDKIDGLISLFDKKTKKKGDADVE